MDNRKTIEKNQKLVLWKKINKINKLLVRLTEEKEEIQLIKKLKLRGKRRHYNWFCRNKKIVIDYYKKLNSNKLNNLDEIQKFLEIQNLSRVNHEEIENLSRPIRSKKIESVMKSFSKTTKSLGPDGFTDEFFST